MILKKVPITWITTPILLIAFLSIWHFYVVFFDISKFILPPPIEVLKSLIELLSSRIAWGHTWITVYETVVGFIIACIVGVGLGTLLGKVYWLERALNPFIIATQVVPKVALVPLFILWFGFGMSSKVIVSALNERSVVIGTESSPTISPLTYSENQLSAHTSAVKVEI